MRRMTVPCQYIDFQGYPFKLVNNFVPIGADIVERVLTLYRMDRMTIYELDVGKYLLYIIFYFSTCIFNLGYVL